MVSPSSSSDVAPILALLLVPLTVILGAALLPGASGSSGIRSSGGYSSGYSSGGKGYGYGSDSGYGSPSTMIDPTVTMVEPDSLGGWVLSKTYWWLIYPVCHMVYHGVRCMFQYAIIPFFELFFGSLEAMLKFFVLRIVKPTEEYFITPVCNAIVYVLTCVSCFVGYYLHLLASWVSVPVQAIAQIIKGAIWWLLVVSKTYLEFFYLYVLVPVISAVEDSLSWMTDVLAASLSNSFTAILNFLSWIGDKVLPQLDGSLIKASRLLFVNLLDFTCAAAEFIYETVCGWFDDYVVPAFGNLVSFVGSWIVSPLASVGELLLDAVIRFALVPLADAIIYLLTTIWRCCVFAAYFVWTYLLSPVCNVLERIIFLALQMFANGEELVWDYLLQPLISLARGAFTLVLDWIVKPILALLSRASGLLGWILEFMWSAEQWTVNGIGNVLGWIYDSLERLLYPESAVLTKGKYKLSFSTGELTPNGSTVLMPGQAGSKIQMRLRNGESQPCNCVIWVNGSKQVTVRLPPNNAAYSIEQLIPAMDTSVVEAVFLPKAPLGTRLPSHCNHAYYDPFALVEEEAAECFAVDEAKAMRLRVELSTAAPARDEL